MKTTKKSEKKSDDPCWKDYEKVGTKTKNGKKTSLLGGATKSLRKLGRGTANSISGLSTTQKVVGSAALVALGLSYFSKRNGKHAVAAGTDDAAEHSLNAMDGSTEGAL